MQSDLWVEEKVQDVYGMRFKVERVLFSGKSEFQSVDVVETTGHGKMLLNDGLVMLTERDEHVYHEMIVHVPMFTHPNPKTVLVIGGGDGGTAREVLRHPGVERVVMVEIDKMVVDACLEHIPQTSACLSDKRLELRFEDGVAYVNQTKEKFDVVIVDSTDPIGPAQPLFGDDFYRDIYACLNAGGIVVSQGESPFYHEEMQAKLISILHKFFPKVLCYNFHNLSYPGGYWSFSYGSKGLDPKSDFKAERLSSIEDGFKYYNAETHVAAFALPEFQKKNIGKFLKP
jgi:spermidine synthase